MKTITTYSFSELSDEAKEKAIEAYRNSDGLDWYSEYDQLQYELSDAKDVLIGAPDFPIYLQDLVKSGELSSMKVEELDSYRGTCKVSFVLTYSQVEADLVDSEDYDESQRGESMYETREAQVREDLQDFCLSWMRKQEDWITSDEYISEHLIANEYDFLESGTMV